MTWSNADLEEYKSIQRWAGNLRPNTFRSHLDAFRLFMDWLQVNGGELSGLGPDQLVEYQLAHRDYGVLDLVQAWVRENQDLRHNTVTRYYAVARSFFKHNRAALPDDVFRPLSETAPVDGNLSMGELKRIILASNPMYRAIWLVMFQGIMGAGEVVYWSDHGYGDLVEHLEADEPILEATQGGRKKYLNVLPFYNLIGGDARGAVAYYLDKVRPQSRGGPIFINKHGKPLKYRTMQLYWRRKIEELGLITPPEDADKSTRYGKNLHEIRDLARTRWKRSPADKDLAEFMMGHMEALDPNKYDKIFRDRKYSKREYRKALPWLNILTEDPESVPIDQYESQLDRIDELERRVVSMEPAAAEVEAIKAMLQHPGAREILLEAVKKLEHLPKEPSSKP